MLVRDKGEKKGQSVLTVSVQEEVQKVRPPRRATSELLQLERVSEKALLPLLGCSAAGDGSIVVVGGDDTTKQQDGDGSAESPEEGVHWRSEAVVLWWGQGRVVLL
jgi:hypothetical protein